MKTLLTIVALAGILAVTCINRAAAQQITGTYLITIPRAPTYNGWKDDYLKALTSRPNFQIGGNQGGANWQPRSSPTGTITFETANLPAVGVTPAQIANSPNTQFYLVFDLKDGSKAKFHFRVVATNPTFTAITGYGYYTPVPSPDPKPELPLPILTFMSTLMSGAVLKLRRRLLFKGDIAFEVSHAQ